MADSKHLVQKIMQATDTIDEVFAEVECEVLFQAMANVLGRMLYENLKNSTMRQSWMERFVVLVGTIIYSYEQRDLQPPVEESDDENDRGC